MDEIRIGTLPLVTPADHVLDYRERPEEVVQVQRPMRGSTGRTVRRGGALTTITFTVERTHESHVAARAYCRAQTRALLATADTTVTYSVSGAGSSSGQLLHAHAQISEASAYGVVSRISYTITGAEDLPS